jgi:hypothetical protein
VLEPRAHPGLRHGFGDRRRGQAGGVVLDAQPLADHVRVERLEAREALEPPLEDGHLLVAVHPLDLEGRFGVQLADRAGRRAHRPGSCDVRQRLLEQFEDVVVVHGVVDQPARRGAGARAACPAAAGAGARRPTR